MDKQNVAYLHSGIVLGHRKEWNTDTCYNMDKPWKDYAIWKKSVTKPVWLYLHEMSKIDKPTKIESMLVVARKRGEEGMESDC